MSSAVTPTPWGRPRPTTRALRFSSATDDGEEFDVFTTGFLRSLPPQQRLTLLLVYGERFDHIDAGRVLDVPFETIGARLVRISASLADRLSAREQSPASATIETLYPEGPRA